MKATRLTLAQRLVLLCLATALVLLGGVACNTAQGFGKDVEAAGEGIQEGTK